MIGLSKPEVPPSSSKILPSVGGFAWWYIDLVDEQGNGVVLIWSWGLPFLPGWMSGLRGGDHGTPHARPSLNVVTYDRGRPNFYLLQEYPPEQCSWGPNGTYTFGDSTITTVTESGRRRVTATLNCPVPGTHDRLRGSVRLDGPVVRHDVQEQSRHHWTPICTAVKGEMDLSCGDLQLVQGSARAYHDRNASTADLESLGIDHWIWGRVPHGDGERIYYLLWPSGGGAPRAIGLTVSSDGSATRTETLTIRLASARRAWFGMPWWSQIELLEDGDLWARVTHRAPLDDGPFYLRFHTEVETEQGRAVGVGEAVRPSRIDLAIHRPLVRMAVHHTAKPNSIWLPLFCGPTATRWRRLFGPRRPHPRAVEATS